MKNAAFIRICALLTLACVILSAASSGSSAQSPLEKTWLLELGRGISATDPASRPSLRLEGQRLSGSTGCNSFIATLSEIGEQVKIENLSLTRKLCATLQNDNERAFVNALGQTQYLTKEPDKLTFLSDKREPLLVWKSAEPKGGSNEGSRDRSLMVPRVTQSERVATEVGEDRSNEPPKKAVARHPRHAHLHRGRRAPDCAEKNVCTPVRIFFGTNRERKDAPEYKSFGPERGKQLALGTTLVTIPQSHGRGEVERPSYWDYWDLLTGLKEDPSRHFVIVKDGVKIFESVDDFINEILSTGEELHQFRDHAFVFVHGFNVSFDDALYRTAQIAFDLGARVNGVHEPFGLPFLYSWPSKGTFSGYVTDEDSARLSLDYLKKFLQLVVAKSGAKNVHLIAHSMGNQPLLHVLEEVAKDNPKVVFNQIILAAPDVDRDEFEKIAASIGTVAMGITLYASSNDKAMRAARMLRDGRVRAGDVSKDGPVVVIGGIDSIDVSAVSTGVFTWNHDTYFTGKALINDIGLLLRNGVHPPNVRTPIYEQHKRLGLDLPYWVYPR